jgi:hypothetical protein
VGAQASVVSGGILCLLGVAAVVRLFPELRAHVVEDPASVDSPIAPAGTD